MLPFLGKAFNANPTSTNHKQVEDADRILHACHNQLTSLIKQHLGIGPTENQSKKKERLLAQMIQSARTLTAWYVVAQACFSSSHNTAS